MSTTVIYTLVAILAVAGIFWLVVYSSRRGPRTPREDEYQTAGDSQTKPSDLTI